MNGPALLVAVVAVSVLLWDALAVRQHRRWLLPFGLACFAAAYVLQQVLQGMHQYAVR